MKLHRGSHPLVGRPVLRILPFLPPTIDPLLLRTLSVSKRAISTQGHQSDEEEEGEQAEGEKDEEEKGVDKVIDGRLMVMEN